MSPEPGAGRGTRVALALVTLAALLLRAVGLDFGVPVWEEPDAVIAMHVERLREGDGRGDRRFSDQNYPHLVARLTQPLPGPRELEPGAPVEAHLARAARTHVQVRGVVALLSLLAIPAAFALARSFDRPGQGPGAGLLAAALAGSSLLLFSFSQQGRPHAAAGGLLPLAVVAAMRLARHGRPRDQVLAGLAAAAALGVLQTGVFVLPTLALACLIRPRSRRGLSRILDPWAGFQLALLAAATWAFYPFLFGAGLGEGAGGLGADEGRVSLAEHSVALADFLDGGGFRVCLLSLWNYDPALLLGGALGLVGVVLRRDRGGDRGRELAVALSFALPYLAVIGLFAKTYERFAIPLLPFLAALAAVGLSRLTSGLAGGARLAMAGLLVVLPLACCAKLAWLRARPDTLDQAGSWIESELETDQRVVLPASPRIVTAFDVPLWRRSDELVDEGGRRIKQHSPWTRYQLQVLSAAGDLSEPPEPRWAVRWLVPCTPEENRLMARDKRAFTLSLAPAHYVIEPFELRFDHAAMVELRETLAGRGELVARFTPDGPGGKIEWPFFYMLSDHFNTGRHEDWPHFVPRLLRASAIGPYVEIYRVGG